MEERSAGTAGERGQRQRGRVGPPPHCHHCHKGLCALLPSGRPSCTSALPVCCSCFGTAEAPARRLFAARTARHEQLYLLLLI